MEISSVQVSREIKTHVTSVLHFLPKGSTIKFVRDRGFDKLLCEHVFFGFCQQCGQWKCDKRSL